EFMCVPYDIKVQGLVAQEITPESPMNGGLLRIEILRRSGLANSGWNLLVATDVDSVRSRLQGLPSTSNPNWPSRLGYGGILVRRKASPNVPPIKWGWEGGT